jgi:hypothetical protein
MRKRSSTLTSVAIANISSLSELQRPSYWATRLPASRQLHRAWEWAHHSHSLDQSRRNSTFSLDLITHRLYLRRQLACGLSLAEANSTRSLPNGQQERAAGMSAERQFHSRRVQACGADETLSESA